MKYIIRFDDITHDMSWQNFFAVKQSLENLGIRSVLGVVPENLDLTLQYEPPRTDFFDLMRKFRQYGDTIAQHGTHHCYTSDHSGILGINRFSEFAGLNYIDQLALLRTGKNILQKEGIWEPYFMAPAHSFDSNTLKALLELEFIGLTDGYGFFPYNQNGLKLIPALTSSPFNVGFGYCTICLHTNTMSLEAIERLLKFVVHNRSKFIDFKSLFNMNASSGIHHIMLRQMTRYGLKYYRWLMRIQRTKNVRG